MRPSIVILLPLLIVGACIATIFWALDSSSFYALEDNLDLSDAILTTIILVLLALIPSRFKT